MGALMTVTRYNTYANRIAAHHIDGNIGAAIDVARAFEIEIYATMDERGLPTSEGVQPAGLLRHYETQARAMATVVGG